MKRATTSGLRNIVATALVAVACAGCNPNLDVDGALIPAWLTALVAGVAAAVGARSLLIRWGLDRHLVARPWVYVSLTITFSGLLWLLFFRT